MSYNSATLSSESGVLSARLSSSLSLAQMTCTVSPMGTSVKNEDTSKLTSISSSPRVTFSAKYGDYNIPDCWIATYKKLGGGTHAGCTHP